MPVDSVQHQAREEPNRDDPDLRLREATHPETWTNPDPPGRYDLVVIGGGTAGLVSAMGAASLGARVALVERERLGGDCLNTGCVPSKALLRSARAAADARRAPGLGIGVTGVNPDFAAVMRRMRERRADISPHDSAERLRAAGVDVYFGEARFSSRSAIDVAGRTLTFRRAVIATGGRPAVPPIPGLAQAPYLTSENVFALSEQPRRLAIVGAGPIGCELAQAFARLGTAVTIVDDAPRVLSEEDPDAAAIVARRLVADGVTLRLDTHLIAAPDGFDCLLIAVGRVPNVESLDLAAAGIGFGTDGVVVDDHLRTSNHRVFAAGDVCSRFKFTHAADALARIVIRNALFFGRKRASALVIPRCTYTDPEVAHVGACDGETITIPMSAIDRAIIDDDPDGFVRVHHERGRLRGCTIVAARAGEMIAVATHALTRGASLAELGETIYPYPTLNNAFRAAGDAYGRARLTSTVRRAFRRYFRLF